MLELICCYSNVIITFVYIGVLRVGGRLSIVVAVAVAVRRMNSVMKETLARLIKHLETELVLVAVRGRTIMILTNSLTGKPGKTFPS